MLPNGQDDTVTLGQNLSRPEKYNLQKYQIEKNQFVNNKEEHIRK